MICERTRILKRVGNANPLGVQASACMRTALLPSLVPSVRNPFEKRVQLHRTLDPNITFDVNARMRVVIRTRTNPMTNALQVRISVGSLALQHIPNAPVEVV